MEGSKSLTSLPILKICNFIWITRKFTIYENLKFLGFCLDPEIEQEPKMVVRKRPFTSNQNPKYKITKKANEFGRENRNGYRKTRKVT